MYILSVHIWFQNLIRQFFFSIDSIIFNFIPSIYNLLIDIARTSVLSQADISDIATRIYQLLSIFMVFKVVFSLIMYVVNPDDFSDSNKGVSKLGTNIVISLSLLILVPYIFSYAFQLQTIILEDNSLGTLVFGDTNDENDSTFAKAGDSIAFITMSPFLVPNTSLDELQDCITLTKNGKFNKECSGLDFDNEEIYIDGSDNTLAGIAQDEEKNKNKNFSITDVANYVYGVEKKNLGLMHRQEIILATAELSTIGGEKTQQYIFDYKFIFSTAIGIVVLLLLINFCMDVAVRSIKLSFLQLIAPIPILSYIDPKSGKDGMFKKWYQLCFKTYASLFVRLLALYFGIFIIAKIDNISDVVNGSYQSSLLVKIFVIIGVLMFIKQLPNLLEGLGIKLDGDGKFTLNPFKKFGEEAIGGKKILGLGAAGAAGLAAGATNFLSRVAHPNSWRDEEGKFSLSKGLKSIASAPGSAFAGATSALWRGGKKAMRGEKAGKIFGDSYGEAMFAKVQREDLARQGATTVGKSLSDFNRKTGNLDAYQNQEMWAANVEKRHQIAMDALKEERESVGRAKKKVAKAKQDKTTEYSRRKYGYEGMKKTVDGFVDKSKTFEVEEEVWDPTEKRYKPQTRRYEYNVKDALDRRQQLIANGNYTVKIGQQIAERDSEGKVVYDADGKIKMRTATAEDVARGVKTDEAIAIENHIKIQQEKAMEYLTSEEGKTSEAGKMYAHFHTTVEKTGETPVDSYDSIKTGVTTNSQILENIDLEYEETEKEFEQREAEIEEREATEIEQYMSDVERLGLGKNSEKSARNKANHSAVHIRDGQKQPENFTASADNAYGWYNTNLRHGTGPGGGMPPGPGHDD